MTDHEKHEKHEKQNCYAIFETSLMFLFSAFCVFDYAELVIRPRFVVENIGCYLQIDALVHQVTIIRLYLSPVIFHLQCIAR